MFGGGLTHLRTEHVLKRYNLFVLLCSNKGGRIGILPTFSLGPMVVVQCLLPTHPEMCSDWFGSLVFVSVRNVRSSNNKFLVFYCGFFVTTMLKRLSHMQSYRAKFQKISCIGSCVNGNRDRYSGKCARALPVFLCCDNPVSHLNVL